MHQRLACSPPCRSRLADSGHVMRIAEQGQARAKTKAESSKKIPRFSDQQAFITSARLITQTRSHVRPGKIVQPQRSPCCLRHEVSLAYVYHHVLPGSVRVVRIAGNLFDSGDSSPLRGGVTFLLPPFLFRPRVRTACCAFVGAIAWWNGRHFRHGKIPSWRRNRSATGVC